ncbi:cyclic nucleotide-binding protein [Microlunatus sagamiharensis]|uniref:Cyclic nucleotide-binding protein n=1 Tax=Microlunatus sagamiharensis TaxID=546874 RepID=A0A1H2LMU6_9ACTN|nr:putative nucleotidyltransferase substrate binding domain-containing protein [Microlunatus sagamiharensis]SDU81958.1 cyclic nucleotide-binding protein [Microlunatus sagamiharensis]
MDAEHLGAFLAEHPPFDTLDRYALTTLAEAATLERAYAGELVVDAFAEPTVEVFVVVEGRVGLWNDRDQISGPAQERVGPGGLFGFSAMLTGQPVGPRAVALRPSTVARLPEAAVLPAFTSPGGSRFLASEVADVLHGYEPPTYSTVADLVRTEPLLVDERRPVAEAVQAMTEHGHGYCVVRLRGGRLGLLTDRLLRERVVAVGYPLDAPLGPVVDDDPVHVDPGDSVIEAVVALLDREADYVLVTDRDGDLRGVVSPRDVVVAPGNAGVGLQEQLRRAPDADSLAATGRRLPVLLGELTRGGLASARVLAVHSTLVDACVRRAVELVLAERPELPADGFTWLSIGSNGRREAVLSSDVDSAVAFADDLPAEAVAGLRDAFREVHALLGRAGLGHDRHGAAAYRPEFSRTNAAWRTAARGWLDDPVRDQGAMMTSLLVDARPVWGDLGLPAVARVFGDLRAHPLTMRLLLLESLAYRARLRSVRDLLARRPETFDIKAHALLPITNIARWAALSAGTTVLPTPERLRESGSSEMLPAAQARTLAEVFEVLQGIRLSAQLAQVGRGERPTDVLRLEHLSPLDRSVIASAVREVAAVQRRMDNLTAWLPAEEWAVS